MTARQEISVEEMMQLDKLRHDLPQLSTFTDGWILRWLRARGSSTEEALTALRKHMTFRKAWGLDQLLTSWKRPQVLERYLGYGFFGPDREGSPVLVSMFGNMDVEGVLKSVESQDYIKFSLMVIEQGVRLCDEMSKQNNKPFEQLLLILDLDNMTDAHYNFKTFAASFLTLLAIYQENYPLLFKKILVVNAPSIARYAYQVMTPFFYQSTQELIDMPSDSDYTRTVLKYVSANRWPKCFGGEMTDPDGNPNCPSMLTIGMGPVPERYYVDLDRVMPQSSQRMTLYPASKHLVEISVHQSASRICWKYTTDDGDDVGFAIYYRSRGSGESADERQQSPVVVLPSDEEIFPYVRLECSVVPVTGLLVCERPGTYIIEFDNEYSWFSAKELRYFLDLIEPELCSR